MTMTSPSHPETSPRRDVGDLVSGLVSAVFGAAVLLHVQNFPRLSDGAPGPALFPGIIAGLFVVFGLVLVYRYFRGGSHSSPVEDQDRVLAQYQSLLSERISPRTAWINALSVLGSIVFYLVAADFLGFSLTMTILLAALMWRLGARSRVALPAAVVTTVVIYVLFQRLLLVPLPAGLLG